MIHVCPAAAIKKKFRRPVLLAEESVGGISMKKKLHPDDILAVIVFAVMLTITFVNVVSIPLRYSFAGRHYPQKTLLPV